MRLNDVQGFDPRELEPKAILLYRDDSDLTEAEQMCPWPPDRELKLALYSHSTLVITVWKPNQRAHSILLNRWDLDKENRD